MALFDKFKKRELGCFLCNYSIASIRKKVFLVLLLFSLTPKSFAQVVHLPQEAKTQKFRDYSLEESGFWFAIEGTAASSIILNHRNVQRAILSFTGGYRINEFFRIGAGLGGNCYFLGNKDVRGDENMFTMPVYLDLRGSITSQEVRTIAPYWSFDIGANLGDGFFVSPTIGFRFGEKRNSFLLGFSYTIGKMNTTFDDIYPSTTHSLGLKLGYEF